MTRSGTGRVLVTCLREAGNGRPSSELQQLIRSADLDALVAESIRQRVGGALLATLLGSERRDEAAVRDLRRNVEREVAWQMFLVAITHRVASALDDASVPYAVVKGPVLAEHVYPEPSWRTYRDLDVLVTSSDAPRARATLESMGARLAPIQREITDLGFDGEVAMLLPEGLNIDLHHELVNDRDARQHFTVPIGELLHRRRTIDIDGHGVSALDPTDQMLHLCLHAAISNGRQLVWLLDIDQAFRRDPPDLELLVRRAHRWQVGLATAVLLERARLILHTPIQDEVLDELASAGLWRRFCHVMMRVRPPETGASAALSGGVVVASTRSDTKSSMLALAKASWAQGVLAPLHDSSHPWRRRRARANSTGGGSPT
jgi:hypothetical protein